MLMLIFSEIELTNIEYDTKKNRMNHRETSELLRLEMLPQFFN